MRADRLVNLLLILQRRGRVTATTLSDELDVSVRTVLRDVQSLHEAGIPISTSQGAGGGIELVAGFRTILTGLTTDEAAGVLLIGQPGLAQLLGLAEPTASARHKILAALAPEPRRRAEELDTWFHLDPDGWSDPAPAQLDRLATATQGCLVVELSLDGRTVEVQPLGLVTRAGEWHLVQLTSDGPTSAPLTGLTVVRITRRRFDRPSGFDLSAWWHGHGTRNVSGAI